MSDSTQTFDLAGRYVRTGQAVARLAQDDAIFRGAVDAFRAGDAESFLKLLDRVKARPFCDDLCRWFASKQCVLDCLELCGPPTASLTVDQITGATVEIVRMTADEELVERLADIVERRDAKDFKAFVQEQKLQAYCRIICHWVCTVRYTLICEVICQPLEVPERELAGQLSLAGSAIGQVAKNADELRKVIDASIAFNCDFLRDVLGGFNDCYLICGWICSWRAIYFCWPICGVIDVAQSPIDEMLAFAKVSGRLADTSNAYVRLLTAVQSQDQSAFQALVKELEIGTFCFQLCHWISVLVCEQFCICICPLPETIPLFTKVGKYHVAPVFGDFRLDGTTTAGGYAFSTLINLNGILPDGTAADALEYRFTYQTLPGPGPTTPITGPMIPSSTTIGQLEYWEFVNGAWGAGSTDVYVNNPGATANIAQQFPPGSFLTPSVDTDADVNGWIKVPRNNSLFQGGVGRFVPNGLLAQLDTTLLTKEPFDLTVAGPGLPVLAGAPVPLLQQSVKPLFKINFEARKVLTLASVGSNSLAVIALSNTDYTFKRHPDWAGSTVTLPPVVSLDLLELQGGGCLPLGGGDNTVHALFTVYHPYLGSTSLDFVGPAPLPPVTIPVIPPDGDVVSGAAGLAIDISMLVPCAYVVFLNANLNLTNGDSVLYGTFQDFIAFCKR